MLSQEQNDLLTRTGKGTPGGALLRCYWQPAALAEELPPDGAPIPIRLLGEDLVLFRDEHGEIGLLGLRCPHRGTDLSYGRIEDGGLRCLYHGWLFDRAGNCLEQPGEPADSTFKDKIRHTAYPCREVGGVILAYLGDGEPPLVPDYEFLRAPEERRYCTKLLNDCNYLQGNEGNIDPQHLSFLHRQLAERPGSSQPVANTSLTANSLYGRDLRPRIEIEETDFGVRIFSIRKMDETQDYVRITNFIMPNLSAFQGSGGLDGYQVHWHVPIDDTHHWKYVFSFHRTEPMDKAHMDQQVQGELAVPYIQKRSAANRYLQDRDEMRSLTFTGIGYNNFQAQDRFAVESQGAIQDRTAEHLGTTDRCILAARKMLLAALKDVQEGRDPPHVIRDAAANDLSHIVVKSEAMPADVTLSVERRVPSSAATGDSSLDAQNDPA